MRKPKLTLPIAYLILGMVLTGLFGLLMTAPPLGYHWQRVSYDLFSLLQVSDSEDISDLAIIYLDEESHEILNQPYDRPWDRGLHARLIDRLTRIGARVVVFDIMFEMDSSNPEADAALERAILENGNIVLGQEFKKTRISVDPGNPGVMKQVWIPVPLKKEFAEAARAVGFVNLNPDSDYAIRKHLFQIEAEAARDLKQDYYSAVWQAVYLIDNQINIEVPVVVATGENAVKEELVNKILLSERWLKYYGQPFTVNHYSYADVLNDAAVLENLRDKIVFVGSNYTGGFSGSARDSFTCPFSWKKSLFYPGVEVHAMALQNLLDRDWFTRIKLVWELVFIVLLGGLVSLLLSLLTPRLSWIAGIVLGVVFFALSIYCIWYFRILYNWMVPLAFQLPFALIWSVSGQYYIEFKRRVRLKNAFNSYLSPQMTNQIMNSDFDLKPGGELRQVTVMFTDLAGFTSLSEGANPSEISHILNTYFNVATKSVQENGGTILDFIGDAVFAVWGAPMDDESQADHAVKSAIGLISSTHYQKIFGHPLRTRVGISSGMGLAGNLGSDTRFDYTVIGDNTNLASRIEGLNKKLGTSILVAESSMTELKETYNTRYLGKFCFVGKDKPVPIHQVIVDIEEPEEVDEELWKSIFAEALEHFMARRFDEAEKLFHKTIRNRAGQDGPSRFYLNLIEQFSREPPSEHWRGEVRLFSK